MRLKDYLVRQRYRIRHGLLQKGLGMHSQLQIMIHPEGRALNRRAEIIPVK